MRDLTRREQEVLSLIAKGLRDKQIAESLGVLPNTVKSHTRNIFSKLEVHNRTQATLIYLSERI